MGNMIDCVYGILVAIVGLMIVVTPYDKFKEKVPKAPSPAVVKVLGVVVLLMGIGLIALAAMGLM